MKKLILLFLLPLSVYAGEWYSNTDVSALYGGPNGSVDGNPTFQITRINENCNYLTIGGYDGLNYREVVINRNGDSYIVNP